MFEQIVFISQAEGQLSKMNKDKEDMMHQADEKVSAMQTKVDELESEKQELLAFLEEEKR